MANVYSWESFIRIHGGDVGARDVFEKVMDDLLRAENPDKEVHIVKASQGDGGIDVYVTQEDGIDIYQCKFFMGTLDLSRWRQINGSFKKAMEPKGVKVLRWFLCMPREMQKEDIAKWNAYKEENERAFTGVRLRFIDGNEIISRLETCDRVRNTSLIDTYFYEKRKKHFTNKNLIIPFTMSKANGAQGDTYVPRDDLLAKIEEGLKTERIVFLSGMGGCGKSELARAYGYRHRDDYEEIFWLTYTGGETSDLMSMMSNANTLCEIKKEDVADFSNKVLIIVDNLDSEEQELLHNLENGTGNADIIITTRRSFIGSFTDSTIVVASENPQEFAVAVFSKNYCKKPRHGNKRKIEENDYAAVRTICQVVQYNTMIVSLLGIRLRDYKDLSISDCAEKVRQGVSTVTNRIKYSKDGVTASDGLKEILRILFLDILNYELTDDEKKILTVLSLSPAILYQRDYIYALLESNENGSELEYATNSLLDFGWLQENANSLIIHPLIAEVITDEATIRTDSDFYNGLVNNYLGMPDGLLGKERFLVNKILSKANVTSETKLSAMLLINHPGYKKVISDINDCINAAYFVYVNHNGKRQFLYYDLEKNETQSLFEVSYLKGHADEKVRILAIYNKGIQYKLNLDVAFFGQKIEEVPDGLCYCDLELKELVLSDHTLNIGDEAFCGCKGLRGELNLPVGLERIGYGAFWECGGLSGELLLPEGLLYIENSAFNRCSGFRGELRLPDSLLHVGDFAFFLCSGFSDIYLPHGLKVKEHTFMGCNGVDGRGGMVIPVENIDNRLRQENGKNIDELIFDEGVTYIEDKEYYNCKGLKGELCFPDSVSRIGNYAFTDCNKLTGRLRLPENVILIGEYAFAGCSGLTGNLLLPDSLEELGSGAFWGCYGFTGELRLPGRITSINERTFEGCSGFSGTLCIPENVESIGRWAFWGCSRISKLLLSENVINIEDFAFHGCNELCGKLVIPARVKKIGAFAFDGCNKIEKIVFKNPEIEISNPFIQYSSLVICGYRYSTAEVYAREHDLVFEEII